MTSEAFLHLCPASSCFPPSASSSVFCSPPCFPLFFLLSLFLLFFFSSYFFSYSSCFLLSFCFLLSTSYYFVFSTACFLFTTHSCFFSSSSCCFLLFSFDFSTLPATSSCPPPASLFSLYIPPASSFGSCSIPTPAFYSLSILLSFSSFSPFLTLILFLFPLLRPLVILLLSFLYLFFYYSTFSFHVIFVLAFSFFLSCD